MGAERGVLGILPHYRAYQTRGIERGIWGIPPIIGRTWSPCGEEGGGGCGAKQGETIGRGWSGGSAAA